jgi:hypothetical protein
MALARLTNDSMASDSKPTESVMYQAQVLRPMVIKATKIDARSNCFGVKSKSLVLFMER